MPIEVVLSLGPYRPRQVSDREGLILIIDLDTFVLPRVRNKFSHSQHVIRLGAQALFMDYQGLLVMTGKG